MSTSDGKEVPRCSFRAEKMKVGSVHFERRGLNDLHNASSSDFGVGLVGHCGSTSMSNGQAGFSESIRCPLPRPTNTHHSTRGHTHLQAYLRVCTHRRFSTRYISPKTALRSSLIFVPVSKYTRADSRRAIRLTPPVHHLVTYNGTVLSIARR